MTITAQRALTGVAAMGALLTLGAPAPLGAQAREAEPPYWAKIAKDVARMRRGPSPDMPIAWEYRRKDLPVRVVARHENWRRVVDPDGVSGWMNARLLSRLSRTAIVRGGVRPMRADPEETAAVLWRAEPGVVGEISECTPRWCLFDVGGRKGWIATAHVWGDDGDGAGAPSPSR